MSDEIKLEKTHALLEKMAVHLANEGPTRREINERFEKIERHLELMDQKKADKSDVDQVNEKLDLILVGLDHQAKQLDIIRTEQAAVSHAINRHENRITALEEKE